MAFYYAPPVASIQLGNIYAGFPLDVTEREREREKERKREREREREMGGCFEGGLEM